MLAFFSPSSYGWRSFATFKFTFSRVFLQVKFLCFYLVCSWKLCFYSVEHFVYMSYIVAFLSFYVELNFYLADHFCRHISVLTLMFMGTMFLIIWQYLGLPSCLLECSCRLWLFLLMWASFCSLLCCSQLYFLFFHDDNYV